MRISRRTTFGIALGLLLGAVPASTFAQSVKLQGHEIDALLSGNTIYGLWEGQQYRQYFDPDGTTIYAADGIRSAAGEWRIEDDEYQSLWQSDAEWEGWFVMEYAGAYYWVSKTTPPTPFRVEEGQQLVGE